MLSSLPSLPLSLYQTFVLEEKHGFNKTTIGLFFADMVKGWALGIALGAPLLAGFLKIVQWAGDSLYVLSCATITNWLMIFSVVYHI